MRGATFFSYALVAMAAGVVAAPVDVVEREMDFATDMKVGTVDVGAEYYHRRQEEASGAAYVLPYSC